MVRKRWWSCSGRLIDGDREAKPHWRWNLMLHTTQQAHNGLLITESQASQWKLLEILLSNTVSKWLRWPWFSTFGLRESNKDGVNENDGRKFLAAAHHMIYGHETYTGFRYSHSLDHHWCFGSTKCSYHGLPHEGSTDARGKHCWCSVLLQLLDFQSPWYDLSGVCLWNQRFEYLFKSQYLWKGLVLVDRCIALWKLTQRPQLSLIIISYCIWKSN